MAELEKKQVNVLTEKPYITFGLVFFARQKSFTLLLAKKEKKKKRKSNAKCIILLYIKCSFMEPGLINCK